MAYLSSLFVQHHGVLYTQRKLICIGSCIAPVISDLVLAVGDRKLEHELSRHNVVQRFRYVDDFLLLAPVSHEFVPEVVVGLFEVAHEGVSFTAEVPQKR